MDLHHIILGFLVIFLTQCSNHMVRCDITDVRLVGGPTSNKGTVEISVDNGIWGPICGVTLDINDVIVICRQLRFTGANIRIHDTPYAYNSTATIGLACNGGEADLSECTLLPLPVGCLTAGAASRHGEGYLGCFVDLQSDRVLPGDELFQDPDMTISYSTQLCKESSTANYTYAGVENGEECFCGEASDDYARHGVGSDANCYSPCSGDPTDSCGGPGYIAIFTSLGVAVGEGVVIILLIATIIALVIYILRIQKNFDPNHGHITDDVTLVQASNSHDIDTGFYHDIRDIRTPVPSSTSAGGSHFSANIYD